MSELKDLEIHAYCEEGGKRKAKCDGKCIENGVVCVHLILEITSKRERSY